MTRLAAAYRRLDPFKVDIALATVLAAAATVENVSSSSLHPLGASIPTGLAACAALAWRRLVPVVTLAVVLASFVTSTALGVSPNSTALLVVLLCAVYSLAAYAAPRTALLGGVVGVVVAWAGILIHGTDTPVDDLFWMIALLGVPWAAGKLVRERSQRALLAEDRAEIAEREREERAKLAVADERARIARELHDVVAHNVSVMVVQAGAGRRMLDLDPGRSRAAFESIEETGRQALVEMRRLLGVLRKDDEQLALAPQPSLEHVDTLLEQVRTAGMPVTLRIEGEPRPLPPGIDLSAYRIVQEALTNALKHAGPASGQVVLRYGEVDLEIEIADDGRGTNGDEPALVSGGNGLVGMRERVALYGGDLRAGTLTGGGYSLKARLPLDHSRV
jgi:signal transduction histidine kinase